jgi:hypothetical protein
MSSDAQIVVGGVIVLTLGAINKWTTGKAATPVLEGGIIAIILLALLSLFGEGASKLAGRFALLVALTAIISELPAILQRAGA